MRQGQKPFDVSGVGSWCDCTERDAGWACSERRNASNNTAPLLFWLSAGEKNRSASDASSEKTRKFFIPGFKCLHSKGLLAGQGLLAEEGTKPGRDGI